MLSISEDIFVVNTHTLRPRQAQNHQTYLSVSYSRLLHYQTAVYFYNCVRT